MIRTFAVGLFSFVILTGSVLVANGQENTKHPDATSLLKRSVKQLKKQNGFSIRHSTSLRVKQFEFSIQGKGELDASGNTFAMEVTDSPFGFEGEVYARKDKVVYRGGLNADQKGWVKKPLERSMLLYKPSTILGIIGNKDLTGSTKEQKSDYKLSFPVPASEAQKYIKPVSGTHVVRVFFKAALGSTAKSKDITVTVKDVNATVHVRTSDFLPKRVGLSMKLNVKQGEKGKVLASPRLNSTINLLNFNHNERVNVPANVRGMLR